MTKRRPVLKQANRLLPSEVTDSFVTDLKDVLSQDGSVRARYLSHYWLSKFAELDPKAALQRRTSAIEKWRSVEERNGLLASKFASTDYMDTEIFPFIRFREILQRARAVILDVLGESPSLDIAYAAYSGGASTSRRRNEGHPALKFLGKADVTRECWQVMRPFMANSQYLLHIESGLEPRFVKGSVLFTVPKNSDIDRVACKEPDLNVFFQKMFGQQIRLLLRRKGINLNDQSINGELARRGSIDGSLATLDLSSASDSVTEVLVRSLLPTDWYFYLDAVRSHVIDVDGETHQLSMFSSMGNGFTFELESVIFYALARACGYVFGIRGAISVYGDDIIVPTELSGYVMATLQLAGFTVNKEKSFVDGDFRESCGAYWHAGEDVKPFFLKGPIRRLTDLIKVLNQLVGWVTKTLGVMDPFYETLWLKYRAFIPESLHGGQDLTSITSLVTGDSPRLELREMETSRNLKHIGGYLQWLQVTALRDDAWSVQINGLLQSGIFRVKKNRQQRADLPVFLSRYDLVDV